MFSPGFCATLCRPSEKILLDPRPLGAAFGEVCLFHGLRRFLLLAAILLIVAPAPAQTVAQDTFTIVALPDTQFYSASYPSIFNAQTAWIAANAQSRNIKLVLGLGDIVDAAGQPAQWQNADAAYKLLDGKVPYLAAIGNHDYDASDPSSRSATAFNRWFGPTRYSQDAWYRGNYPAGSNENFYGVFSIAGHTYLVLVMELMPRAGAVQWAASVLAANPDKEVIVVTHAYVYWDNSRIGRCDSWNAQRMGLDGDNDGDLLWANLLRKYPNIIMVLSGHVTDQGGVGRRADLGDGGNLVNQMLSDYQSYPNGGGGYLRILTITPSLNRIDVTTYSPWADAYYTDSKNQFTLDYRSTGATGTGGLSGHVRSAADCTAVSSAAITTAGGSASSDTYGRFYIGGLTPGARTVSAGKSGWLSASTGATVQSALSGYTKFFLAPAGQLAGSVLTSTGAGIAGASVSFSGGLLGASRTVVTDSTGHYSSGQTAAGSYNLSVSANGYGSTTGVATVSQNQTAAVDFTLVSTADSTCVPPSTAGVNLCSPAAGATVAAPLPVLATATSSSTVSRMELWLDGVKQYQVAGNKLDTSVSPSAGSHRVAVLAINSVGNTLSQAVNVTVSVCGIPSAVGVKICFPTDGTTVASPVAVAAAALSTSPVQSLGIWVDGVKVYSVAANTLSTSLTLASGSHRITVLARDTAGVTQQRSVNITVSP